MDPIVRRLTALDPLRCRICVSSSRRKFSDSIATAERGKSRPAQLVDALVGSLKLEAYADDIAIVLSDMFSDLPVVMKEFSLIRVATALALKLPKCIAVPFNTAQSLDEQKAFMCSILPA